MSISKTAEDNNLNVDETLKIVYNALAEKGYNPISQILGYIFTGDPTYVTPHNNARDLIAQLDAEEIVSHVLEAYFKA